MVMGEGFSDNAVNRNPISLITQFLNKVNCQFGTFVNKNELKEKNVLET